MTSLDALIPELIEPAKEFVQLLGIAGVQPRVTSTLRTHREQANLYRRFLAGHSAYPAAPPGRSSHEFGYAFDVVVVGTDNQNDAGQVWESWGGVWGGRFRDPIHFEYPGFSLGQTEGATGRTTRTVPAAGGAFYGLIDFLSGFVPYLGEAQLVDQVYRLFGGQDAESTAEWYLQHPAEAIRDLVGALSSIIEVPPPPARTVSLVGEVDPLYEGPPLPGDVTGLPSPDPKVFSSPLWELINSPYELGSTPIK